MVALRVIEYASGKGIKIQADLSRMHLGQTEEDANGIS